MKTYKTISPNSESQSTKPFFTSIKNGNKNNAEQDNSFFKGIIQKRDIESPDKVTNVQKVEEEDKCTKFIAEYVKNNWLKELQNRLKDISSTEIETFRAIANEVIGRREFQSFEDNGETINCCFQYVGTVTGTVNSASQTAIDNFIREPNPIPESDAGPDITYIPSSDKKYFVVVYAIKKLTIAECMVV